MPAKHHNFQDFQTKLVAQNKALKKEFKTKYPKAHKYIVETEFDLAKVRQHSARMLGAGALTGALLMTPASNLLSAPHPGDLLAKTKQEFAQAGKSESQQQLLLTGLKDLLPDKPRPLSVYEERLLGLLFDDTTGVRARANLEGEHLNTSYGYIGAEQHLRRYPGDTLLQHGSGVELAEGIAPGLGAWGYFAPSKDALTPQLAETERWYAVVQTLYLPDWKSRLPYLRDWYKYRKVLIVNTNNGNAVVAAIADAGPAAWTGKHFGGSPEVMYHLGGARYKKGPVVVFFVDDPENKVPLGPVDFGTTSIPADSLIKI